MHSNLQLVYFAVLSILIGIQLRGERRRKEVRKMVEGKWVFSNNRFLGRGETKEKKKDQEVGEERQEVEQVVL